MTTCIQFPTAMVPGSVCHVQYVLLVKSSASHVDITVTQCVNSVHQINSVLEVGASANHAQFAFQVFM